MSFTDKVWAANEAETKKTKINKNDATQMQRFNEALSSIEHEIKTLPATIESSSISTVLTVSRGNEKLVVNIFFNTDIWNMYLLACEDTTVEKFEYFHKEATVQNTIDKVAEIIGAFLGRCGSTMALPPLNQ